jgi:hypothetical protein
LDGRGDAKPRDVSPSRQTVSRRVFSALRNGLF